MQTLHAGWAWKLASDLKARRLRSIAGLSDFERISKRRLPRVVWDFVEGGAGDENLLVANQMALRSVRLAPRRLVDVANRRHQVELFGRVYAAPFGVAPIGLANLVRSGADSALAEAAVAANVPYVMSTAASTSLEQICARFPGRTWYQLYVARDRAITIDMLYRAQACGVEVLVLTVDVPMPGRRLRDLRNGFSLPLHLSTGALGDMAMHPAWLFDVLRHRLPTLANLAPYSGRGSGVRTLASLQASQVDPSLTWDDLADLRKRWKGALLVKGILSAEDAQLALRQGVDGLIVSNHGGRQTDVVHPAVAALPSVIDAVKGRVPVLLDSGVRSGSDVARAVALGARAVLLGRGLLHAASALGRAGVAVALDMLSHELDVTMANLGCTELEHLRALQRSIAPERLGG
ncbi:alpha-hydroxy acid oxidase [Thiomonas sp. FB-6]|uniref:alpha-hydroxy acid oxidase n=1 Tax=Thiomonas sp. FB-6 TaxID=1158291 RepID=UPI0018C8F911|nr:alpha-hydroxy acid oxidase [Thiomonas sp. FB-6]